MACLRIRLVVLTLLQLCRAEISDTLHESWYSANVINDGFHPKPITEIFSTEATFSQTNPIVILPKSEMFADDMNLWSTYTPDTHTFPESRSVFPNSISASAPSLTSNEESEISVTTEAPITLPPKSTVSVLTESNESINLQPIKPMISEIQSKPIQTNIEKLTKLSNLKSAPIVPQTNVVINYQEIPQQLPNVPITTQASSLETIESQNTMNIISESTNIPQQYSSTLAPTIYSSLIPPSIDTISSNLVSSSVIPTLATIPSNNRSPLISNLPPLSYKPLPLRIRVLAPSGSITNIKINPTLTTKKPTTTRTRKPKPRKNLYSVCINSCEGPKSPICAAPMSKGLIDPSTLKGFPSICHMACFNAFKGQRYEKLVDSRCGKLRTRIRPLDSKTKLKRNELNKAEYTVDNTGPAVEFVGLD